VEFLTVILVPT